MTEEETYVSSKPLCKYGTDCYRKNPQHFEEYSHLEEESENDGDLGADAPANKHFKTSNDKLDNNGPYGLYLTAVHGIPKEYNDPSLALSIEDLLSSHSDELEESVQFNYMIDVPWLISKYPKECREKPLLIVAGATGSGWSSFVKETEAYPNITIVRARLEIAYGTHHTKMMLFKYHNGLRVVIHTANLIEQDWHQKTQGIYVSPLFPKSSTVQTKSRVSDSRSTDSSTHFKRDLVHYLSYYKNRHLKHWVDLVDEHDMSSAKVYIVASVPGRHLGEDMDRWGHMRVRRLLKSHLDNAEVDNQWPLVCQFSSIGSLGKSPQAWLLGEFMASMICSSSNSSLSATKIQLIFPSVENVRNSLEGYPAGGSLPYSSQTADKQPYLSKYLHQWKSSRWGRDLASPHIKTYLRYNSSFSRIAWMLLTSANLSKAAWGCFEKNRTQLMIRSYELGVLFLPHQYHQSSFRIKTDAGNRDNDDRILVPVDLPPSPYGKRDEPWLVDVPRLEPDSNGNIWSP